MNKAKTEYTEQETIFKAKKAGKDDEVNIFAEVKKIYSEAVHGQDQDFKERVADYADN